MTEDPIERGLLMETIEPSAAFQSRVMRRVHQEAATPPPIPFPWRRGLWIALALVAGLVALLLEPEAAVEGPFPDEWLWLMGAIAGSLAASFLPVWLLRLR
ncbi:MAG: hypothetical protein ACE141_16180 [Bryobacteraceae bacterium]